MSRKPRRTIGALCCRESVRLPSWQLLNMFGHSRLQDARQSLATRHAQATPQPDPAESIGSTPPFKQLQGGQQGWFEASCVLARTKPLAASGGPLKRSELAHGRDHRSTRSLLGKRCIWQPRHWVAKHQSCSRGRQAERRT